MLVGGGFVCVLLCLQYFMTRKKSDFIDATKSKVKNWKLTILKRQKKV